MDKSIGEQQKLLKCSCLVLSSAICFISSFLGAGRKPGREGWVQHRERDFLRRRRWQER